MKFVVVGVMLVMAAVAQAQGVNVPRNTAHRAPPEQTVAPGEANQPAQGGLNVALLWRLDAPKRLSCVALSPDGKVFAAGSQSRVYLYETSTGRPAGNLLGGHSGWITAMAFSPDGTTIVTGGDDNSIRVWDWASGKEIASMEGHTAYPALLRFSRSGKLLASSSMERTVHIWDMEKHVQLHEFKGFTFPVSALFISDDDRQLTTVAAGEDTAGQMLAEITKHDIAAKTSSAPIIVPDFSWPVVFSRDGTKLIGAGRVGYSRLEPELKRFALRVFDVTNGAFLNQFSFYGRAQIMLSPAQNNVIAAFQNSNIQNQAITLWDSETLSQYLFGRDVPNSEHTIAMAMSDNGQILASAGSNADVRLWRIVTPQQ